MSTKSWNAVGLSPFHHKLVDLGAVMVETDGWQRPSRFTFIEDEVDRLRQAVGLLDISPDGKLSLQGREIDGLLAAVFPGMSPLEVGRAETWRIDGGLSGDEVGLARLADDEVFAVTGPGEATGLAERLLHTEPDCAHAVDVTSAFAGVRVTGRYAHHLIRALVEVDTSPAAFADGACAQLRAAEVYGLLIRQDIGGLPSFDLYFGREYGDYMWDALTQSGEQYNVAPYGLQALALLKC